VQRSLSCSARKRRGSRFEYADALLEAARPRAPQAAGRLPLANETRRRAIQILDRERPSTAPSARRLPPVPSPAVPAPPRGEVPPSPREPPPRCEAHGECPLEGKPRVVEGLVDGVKRDVPIVLCDLHFAGIPTSILLEWHRTHRAALKAGAQKKCREIVQAVDARPARAG
jgi:hypothetical protein